MTVGSGSTSEAASRLTAMLDQDSGYGGSEADGQSMSRGWNPGVTDDRFTPALSQAYFGIALGILIGCGGSHRAAAPRPSAKAAPWALP